jgi:hypothetical protein
VRLWSSFSQQGAEQVITYVTLRDLILGLLVLWISFMAAQNLPGLLELLALRHLDLTPGSSYAITTLLRYSLILIGVLVAISQFGLEWGKLQWLIAALGVGLGFGLQEIVANFVSGLIILFEKPVRIGDTVTLGEVTGTVSRIQIRATTITDWDRKEVVIPNKTFITNQLINWSLSDAITRVVFTVGVAYGSDTGLAERLLLEVAHANPRVLPDPEPRAYFKAFADSSLRRRGRPERWAWSYPTLAPRSTPPRTGAGAGQGVKKQPKIHEKLSTTRDLAAKPHHRVDSSYFRRKRETALFFCAIFAMHNPLMERYSYCCRPAPAQLIQSIGAKR